MDLVPVFFYAAICAVLTMTVPRRLSYMARGLIGAAVGILAAITLPALRSIAGV